MPELTTDEQMQVTLGFIDWTDSFLDECAEKVGVTIDHNFDREQCNGCKEYFKDGVMSYNDDNEEVECDECYGTSY